MSLGGRILRREPSWHRASAHDRRHPHLVADRIRRSVGGRPAIATSLLRAASMLAATTSLPCTAAAPATQPVDPRPSPKQSARHLQRRPLGPSTATTVRARYASLGNGWADKGRQKLVVGEADQIPTLNDRSAQQVLAPSLCDSQPWWTADRSLPRPVHCKAVPFAAAE